MKNKLLFSLITLSLINFGNFVCATEAEKQAEVKSDADGDTNPKSDLSLTASGDAKEKSEAAAVAPVFNGGDTKRKAEEQHGSWKSRVLKFGLPPFGLATYFGGAYYSKWWPFNGMQKTTDAKTADAIKSSIVHKGLKVAGYTVLPYALLVGGNQIKKRFYTPWRKRQLIDKVKKQLKTGFCNWRRDNGPVVFKYGWNILSISSKKILEFIAEDLIAENGLRISKESAAKFTSNLQGGRQNVKELIDVKDGGREINFKKETLEALEADIKKEMDLLVGKSGLKAAILAYLPECEKILFEVAEEYKKNFFGHFNLDALDRKQRDIDSSSLCNYTINDLKFLKYFAEMHITGLSNGRPHDVDLGDSNTRRLYSLKNRFIERVDEYLLNKTSRLTMLVEPIDVLVVPQNPIDRQLAEIFFDLAISYARLNLICEIIQKRLENISVVLAEKKDKKEKNQIRKEEIIKYVEEFSQKIKKILATNSITRSDGYFLKDEWTQSIKKSDENFAAWLLDNNSDMFKTINSSLITLSRNLGIQVASGDFDYGHGSSGEAKKAPLDCLHDLDVNVDILLKHLRQKK